MSHLPCRQLIPPFGRELRKNRLDFLNLKETQRSEKCPYFLAVTSSSGGKFGLKNGTKIAKTTYLEVPHSPRKFSLLLIVTCF